MFKARDILIVALAISLCSIMFANASLPSDWQTNPQVAKILMSNYQPPIIVLMWFDLTSGHYQAEIGVPASSGVAGIWSGIVSPIPSFTADNEGYFFKGTITQEQGAQQVYPGTPPTGV